LSVKQEILDLKEAQEELREKLDSVTSALTSLSNSKLPLKQKVEDLRTRFSPLAKSLLEKTQKDLDALNQEIGTLEEQKTQLEQALSENQKQIVEKEEDYSSYIQEQSNMMVSAFLEYLKEHAEEIGLELKRTFSFLAVTTYEDDRYGGCYVPTGNFSIYDQSTKSFIVSTKDFQFNKVLCNFSRGVLDELVCTYSDWYKQYQSSFVSVFFDTLAKQYNYEETFKLTISNNHDFTLELV